MEQRKDLENRIHDYIKNLYKAEYVGLLTVYQDGTEYMFTIGIPSYMSPTGIFHQADSDQEFLDFIYEELRVRNYMRLEFYKVIRKDETREE